MGDAGEAGASGLFDLSEELGMVVDESEVEMAVARAEAKMTAKFRMELSEFETRTNEVVTERASTDQKRFEDAVLRMSNEARSLAANDAAVFSHDERQSCRALQLRLCEYHDVLLREAEQNELTSLAAA